MEKGVRSIKTFKTDEIHMRDPFVYADHDRKKYFLYGTTMADGAGDIDPYFEVFVSNDLETWEGPYVAFKPEPGFWGVRHYWAPEVFKYNDKYYMFASFKGGIGEHRGTGILVADLPEGPYKNHSDGMITLKNHECLDGTFYVDDNDQEWVIFCHEWTEIHDGRMEALKLSKDLKTSLNQDSVEILDASKMSWIRKFGDPRIEKTGYLTDAPFMYKTKGGVLLMLWSSYSNEGYTVAIARSESGKVEGPWTNDEKLLLNENAGHSSLFYDFDGALRLCVHNPDTPHGSERPKFYKLKEENNTLIKVE